MGPRWNLISRGRHARAGKTMDKKAKKKVLQMIPYGAYVVGTKTNEGADHLMFGTWLMQTSFKPPLVECLCRHRGSERIER